MDRDLCVNCDHWREEHYDSLGQWQGQLFDCVEYVGTSPTEERAEKKSAQLRASRQTVARIRSTRAESFYESGT